ncbi:MerR family DNA-binding transcriptional regulator, partial [Kitasatospora sp. NPDC059803]|uniref:MerR family DNA-binding transcriptional regulator n=1 Tax=Kitasatospora sp. NPDC059803 TaxID=3346953 RepID=UPI003646F670
MGPRLTRGGPGAGPPPGPPPARPPHVLPADTPVYVISVAAELSGLHPQTLRQYDRLGMVS